VSLLDGYTGICQQCYLELVIFSCFLANPFIEISISQVSVFANVPSRFKLLCVYLGLALSGRVACAGRTTKFYGCPPTKIMHKKCHMLVSGIKPLDTATGKDEHFFSLETHVANACTPTAALHSSLAQEIERKPRGGICCAPTEVDAPCESRDQAQDLQASWTQK